MNSQVRKLQERPATMDDAPWLWHLYSTLLKPAITEQWGWDEVFQNRNFHTHLPYSLFSVIENNAFAVAAYAAEEKPAQLELHMLLVEPEHQIDGIGTFTLNRLKMRATKLHLPIELSIIPANSVAGFYTKNEFKLTGTTNDKHTYRWQPD